MELQLSTEDTATQTPPKPSQEAHLITVRNQEEYLKLAHVYSRWQTLKILINPTPASLYLPLDCNFILIDIFQLKSELQIVIYLSD